MNSGMAKSDEIASLSSSIDAFHKGSFYLKQPKDYGHRAGIDAMLLASLIPKDAVGHLADLGAGAGAAGLAVAYRSNINVTLVETSPVMADYARQTLDLKENGMMRARCMVLEADVELSGQARVAAGFEDNKFQHVIMNPPFNETGDRMAPDTLKAQAHAMSGEDLFDKWIKTAVAICRPQGQLSLIARPSSLNKILSACEGRFGGIELTTILPTREDDAIRILFTAIKGSKARMAIRPGIVMHEDDEKGVRSYTQIADDLINGIAFLSRR
jgi:tRNA1(Val) A37 N6-methylase TrmN6